MIGSPTSRKVVAGMVGIAAGLALLLSACGTTSTPGTGNTSAGGTPTSTVTCPAASTVSTWHLVTPGQLTIASDTTYAPAEFPDPNNPNHYIGYDMDIARELARRLCLQPNIVKATFDAIIPDLSGPPLGQQRYDMSISSFTINSARQQKVDMIPYFTAGESILTKVGNPAGIKSINDMCGKTIAVQNGTVEKDELDDANGNGPGTSGQAPVCKSNKITIVSNDDQTVVVQQVLNGRADASYQDQPVTDYYVSLHKGQLQDSGITVAPSPEGIVMRKDNPALEAAIQQALSSMRSDGTYLRILTQWGQQNLAYPPLG
jgi:polar amino acid transport system substrate-binding protein